MRKSPKKQTRKPMSAETKAKISLARRAQEEQKRKILSKNQEATKGNPATLINAGKTLALTRTDVLRKRTFQGITPEAVRSALTSTKTGLFTDWSDFCEVLKQTDGVVASVSQMRINNVASYPVILVPKAARYAEITSFVNKRIKEIPLLSFVIRNLLEALFTGAAHSRIDWTYDDPKMIWKIKQIVPIDLRKFKLEEDLEWSINDPDSSEEDGTRLCDEVNRWIVFTPGELSLYPNQAGLYRTVAWPSYFRRTGQGYYAAGLMRAAFSGYAVFLPPLTQDEEMNNAKEEMDNYDWERSIVMKDPARIESLGGNASGGANDYHTFINDWKKEIILALTGQTLTTDAGPNSTYGSTEFHQAQKDVLAVGDAERLAQTLKEQLLKPIVRQNIEICKSLLPDADKDLFDDACCFALPFELAFKGLTDELLDIETEVVATDQPSQSETALAGVQIEKLIEIQEKISAGLLSADGGLQTLLFSYPELSPTVAQKIVDAASAHTIPTEGEVTKPDLKSEDSNTI